MRKPSHIPLFPDAYHRDTTHLTTEEHGAYLLLLMAAWGSGDCTLSNDERRLAALAKMPVNRWRKIAPTVLEFWSGDKGRLFQKRLRKEWAYVNAKREQARHAVAIREERKVGNYGSVDVSSDASKPHHPTNTYGGGGGEGEGEGVLSQDRGSGDKVPNKPFRVVEGGGK